MKRSPILRKLEIGLCVCGIILLTHFEAHGVDIETIRKRVRAGDFLVKSHAIQHAIKEGFDRRHMVEAIINGTLIEKYPDDQRALICGQANLTKPQPSICISFVSIPIQCTLNS